MLTGTEFYVVIKFTTGEQVMAVLESEDDVFIEILNPMSIKTIPIIGEGREHVHATPYCQFTDDNVFIIDKKNVMFIKRLQEVMIPHYNKIVEEQALKPMLQRKRAEDLKDTWGDEKISTEEARKRVAMMVDLVNEEEEVSTFVEGNDTKH